MNDLWNALLHNMRAHADIFIWLLPLTVVFYVVLQLLKGRKERFFLFMLSLTCACIVVMTLVGRPIGEPTFAWRPLASYKQILKNGDKEMLLQCIFNILMYMPLGFLLPKCFGTLRKKKTFLLIAVASSLFIEVMQGAFGMGLFEIDDVLNNTIGATIGMGIYFKIQAK